ncbi:Ran binding domain [Trinorchestia longiramus]|nr:Ran binding domain [Trinorchestia longiramus]
MISPQETPCGNVLKDFPRDQFPRTPSFAAHSVFGSKAGDGIPAKPLFGSTPSVSSASLSFGSAPSRSLFGGASAPDSDTSKSGVFSGPSVGSIFGSTTASVFGGTSASSDSVFGGAGAAGSQPSIFGGAASGSEKPSIFKASVTTPGTSLFDGIAAGTTTSGTTFFGGATPSSVTSLFGGAVSSSSTSVFGGSPAANASGSLFDASKTSTSQSVFGGTLNNFSSPAFGASGPTVFGAVSTTPQTFDGGNSKASSSLFVNPTVSESTPSSLAVTSTVAPSKFGEGSAPTAGTLFGGSSTAESKGFISFADITAEKDGFKSKASTVDMSAWQAKPLFASLNKSNNQSKDDSSDQLHHEEDSHDPHFEPVIPMPDLVEVKTGEENLEVIYSHRSKTFRYDNSTKEWKERGLGDIKILYDPASQKYRLLQRREQIHKLAVHHYLMPGQKLTPLASSETAWCWYAQDFSEDSQGSREQLAAKFKNADVAKEFKTKFEECVAKVEQLSASGGSNSVTAEKLISGSTTTVQSVSSAGIGQPTVLLKKPQQYTSDTESSETGDEDEEDDEDDYVDSSIMFEKACQLEKRLGENWDILGTVILRIVYESDSDGARLMATDEGDLLLLDHIISTDLTYEDLEGTAVSWAAHDLSTQPACHVKLRATFNDDDDKEIFIGTLEEGREFANKGGTTDEDIDAEDEAVACDPKLANAISEMLSELGRLVSESACERKDPGSNPAADMVDAARNTAWDLGKQPNNYRSNYPTQEWARRFVPIASF